MPQWVFFVSAAKRFQTILPLGEKTGGPYPAHLCGAHGEMQMEEKSITASTRLLLPLLFQWHTAGLQGQSWMGQVWSRHPPLRSTPNSIQPCTDCATSCETATLARTSCLFLAPSALSRCGLHRNLNSSAPKAQAPHMENLH